LLKISSSINEDKEIYIIFEKIFLVLSVFEFDFISSFFCFL